MRILMTTMIFCITVIALTVLYVIQYRQSKATRKALIQIASNQDAPLLIAQIDTIYRMGDIIELDGEQFGNVRIVGKDTVSLFNDYIIVR